jgi:hypothetical protein
VFSAQIRASSNLSAPAKKALIADEILQTSAKNGARPRNGGFDLPWLQTIYSRASLRVIATIALSSRSSTPTLPTWITTEAQQCRKPYRKMRRAELRAIARDAAQLSLTPASRSELN